MKTQRQAKVARLGLNKQTVRTMKIKSAVQTGRPGVSDPTVNACPPFDTIACLTGDPMASRRAECH